MNTPSQDLFRRSRLRLALWYAIAMGSILGAWGLGTMQALIRANWMSLEREIESIAGTLHDSLEPILPPADNPTAVLQRIFPDLCVVGQPCEVNPSLIQRHTTGISDRSIYYIRVFDHRGQLLAFSPNQPAALPDTLNPGPWQTIDPPTGPRYHQFTTLLHSAHGHALTHRHGPDDTAHDHPAWGYLQVGRTLAAFDAEMWRMGWILVGGLPLTLGLVAAVSWGLAGLAMQPIYRAYQQQQQFTANAAHELRSPLASLLATVEAALRLPPAAHAEIPTLLHTVERQGRRLSQLVTDLLLLTRLEQSPLVPPPQPCNLRDIVADLTEEFAELAAAKAIALRSQIPDSPLEIWGDESQLYRLLSNLLANALQYTPPGGTVVVTLARHDHTATIAVQDTGIGIPPEAQSRIFERFYRVAGDRARHTGGTGLGLAIAQAIVHLHQGRLWVASDGQCGSTFTVSLPYGPLPVATSGMAPS
jgi:two-component Ni(II)/redox sensor kinase NrsS